MMFIGAGGNNCCLLQQCTGQVPISDIVMLAVFLNGFDEHVGGAKRISKFLKVNTCLLTSKLKPITKFDL